MLRPAALALLATLLVQAAPAEAQMRPGAPSWMVVRSSEGAAVRTAPSAGGEVLGRFEAGALAPATGETREADGALWRRVTFFETSDAWVRDDEVSPARFRTFGDSALPVAGVCGGFEPNWRLTWTEARMSFARDIDGEELREVTGAPMAEGWRQALLVAGADPARRWTLLYEEARCPYSPLDALVLGRGALIVTEGGETSWFVGCCRPSPEALTD